MDKGVIEHHIRNIKWASDTKALWYCDSPSAASPEIVSTGKSGEFQARLEHVTREVYCPFFLPHMQAPDL